jgi:hypothetical protein
MVTIASAILHPQTGHLPRRSKEPSPNRPSGCFTCEPVAADTPGIKSASTLPTSTGSGRDWLIRDARSEIVPHITTSSARVAPAIATKTRWDRQVLAAELPKLTDWRSNSMRRCSFDMGAELSPARPGNDCGQVHADPNTSCDPSRDQVVAAAGDPSGEVALGTPPSPVCVSRYKLLTPSAAQIFPSDSSHLRGNER